MNIIRNDGKLNYELLEKQLKVLNSENVIIMIDPLSKRNRNNLKYFLWDYDNVESFVLSNEFERKIALRYVCKSALNYKKTHELALTAYQRGDFETAKILFLKLVSHGLPDSQSYAKVALCYLQLNDYNNAINYLYIADHLAKDELGINLYAGFIDKIVSCLNDDQKIKVKELALAIDVANQYGFNTLIDIINLVSGTKTDIDSACLIFGLNKEQTQIVKLIIAKQCYFNKMNDYAEVLVTQVEKVIPKSREVAQLLNKTIDFKKENSINNVSRIRIKLSEQNIIN